MEDFESEYSRRPPSGKERVNRPKEGAMLNDCTLFPAARPVLFRAAGFREPAKNHHAAPGAGDRFHLVVSLA
jgi:hypothetical protein